MCLTDLTKMPPSLPQSPKFGYKVFRITGVHRLFGVSRHTKDYEYNLKEWNEADPNACTKTLLHDQRYESGYHVFLNREDAEKRMSLLEFGAVFSCEWIFYTIKKVEVEEITSWGLEGNLTVFVARRIKICV